MIAWFYVYFEFNDDNTCSFEWEISQLCWTECIPASLYLS